MQNSLVLSLIINCVKFNHKLAFDQNVKNCGKKAKPKFKALSRVIPYIVLAKKYLLMNSFFAAQFIYCPLIWMVENRFINKRVKYRKIPQLSPGLTL